METVLVTGAAGFIGSHLCERLLADGYTVVGVDISVDAVGEENIQSFKDHPHFTFMKLDICDREAVQDVFTRVAPVRVAHLAAKADTRDAVDNPQPYIDTNITGTINVFDAARATGVKGIVLASSSSVYGNSTEIPLREDAVADKPISPYGATKRAAELFAHTYHHNFGLNITCLRYFNAYGERNRPGMVPYRWGMALLEGAEVEMSGKGERKRDYTYIGDVIEATVKALKKPLGYEIINIGNNHPLSLRELLSVFEKTVGTTANIKERPSHRASVEVTYANIDKAKKLLDWEPKVPIEEGISRLIAWLRAHRLKQ